MVTPHVPLHFMVMLQQNRNAAFGRKQTFFKLTFRHFIVCLPLQSGAIAKLLEKPAIDPRETLTGDRLRLKLEAKWRDHLHFSVLRGR